MIKPITVEPSKKLIVNAVGRYFRCREASAAFQLKVGSDTYTLEGGDEFTVRDDDPDFRQLTFINLSDTDDLTVDFFAGKNVVRNAYVKLPRTRSQPAVISLAVGATQDFPGIDDSGKRRKQFTMTLKNGMTGQILVRNADTGGLVAIIGAGATAGIGFALETDDNLQIQNKTGTNPIESESASPTISVIETFYR